MTKVKTGKIKLYEERDNLKSIFTNQHFTRFCETYEDADKLTNILFNRYQVDSFSYSCDATYWHIYEYFKNTVIPHKIEVRNAGLELLRHDWFKGFISQGSYYHDDESVKLFKHRLFIHDLSKFSIIEAYGYAFHNFKDPSKGQRETFEKAWHHHKMNNPHHPEYWFSTQRDGATVVLEMPNLYIGEMIADWMGASRTYGTPLKDWIPNNLKQFTFHEKTLQRVISALHSLGIEKFE